MRALAVHRYDSALCARIRAAVAKSSRRELMSFCEEMLDAREARETRR